MTDAVPTISLLTDFGLQDPFVGVMKAVIAARCPAARVIDLTHGIEPQAVEAAAFWLERSYRWFPAGTVHVGVVDPGVGTERRAMVAEESGHRFVAPDNGLLSRVLTPASTCHVVDTARLGLAAISRTFHGRDVFAPVAADLAAGRLTLAEVGPAMRDWTRSSAPPPAVLEAVLVGRVWVVDRFGNAISDISGQQVEAFGGAWIEVCGVRAPIRATYAAVERGEYVAVINAFGTLELARRNGSAAAALDVRVGTPVRVVRAE